MNALAAWAGRRRVSQELYLLRRDRALKSTSTVGNGPMFELYLQSSCRAPKKTLNTLAGWVGPMLVNGVGVVLCPCP